MKRLARCDETGKESLLFLLLAHHRHDQLQRTIHVKLWNWNLYLCARGVGRYSGLITVFILSSFFQVPLWFYPLSFVFFPIPSMVDWALQKSGARESRNSLRIPTGFLVGISQGLLIVSYLQSMQTVFAFGIIVMILYFLAFCFEKYSRTRENNFERK